MDTTIITVPAAATGTPCNTAKSRQRLAKRCFTGLVGRAGVSKRKSARKSVNQLIEDQRAKTDLLEAIKYDGWKPGDDDPIVKSSRARSGSGTPVFQKYQFRLRANGAKNARWDRGMTPHIYDSMASERSVRDLALDPENRGSSASDTVELYKGAHGKPTESVSIASVAQSMPKGFSTGVLSSRFDYTNPPRRSRPETAWIFNDARLKYFVTRSIDDADVEAAVKVDLENNYWLRIIIRKFARAIKSYVALYSHFKIGLSDEAFLDDPSLDHQRFWTSKNALTCYRGELIKKGVELFGTPASPKEVPNYDPDRVRTVWPVFMKVFRALPYSLPNA